MTSLQPSLNFIFIGRSGCGKGTQAQLLREKFPNTAYVSTGDLMRLLAQQPTDVGVRINLILGEGGLPFDDIAAALWMHEIAFKVKADQGIIADGFPRRLNEAQTLDRFLDWLGRKDHTKVLFVDISREEAFKRLKSRARGDDSDALINNRLDYYEARVVPAIEYYRQAGRLIHINGEQGVEEVFQEILQRIQ